MRLPIVRMSDMSLLAAELALATLLFARQLKPRRHWPLRCAASLLALAVVSLLMAYVKDFVLSFIDTSAFNTPYFVVTYLLTMLSGLSVFAVFVASVRLVFETTVFHALFIGCASYATQNIARCALSLSLMRFGPIPTFSSSILREEFGILIYLSIYAIVYVSCYFVFFRRYQSGDEDFINRKILAILIAVIAVNSLLSAVYPPKDSDQASMLYTFVLLSRIFLCVMGLIMQFFVLDWLKLRFQQSQLEQLLESQKAQFEIAKKSIDTVNINAHDLKHQIAVITSAIHQSESARAIESELDEMRRMIDTVDTAYRTGNKALDVTLTEKSRICQSKDICLSVIADGAAVRFMSDVDIYILFGNALDNAIEATEAIADPSGRIISASVRQEQGVVSIHVENTFAHAPTFENGMPQTQKHDKAFHGYGVKSIQRIVEKYGGNMKAHLIRNLFCLDVILTSA
ncbi:MAG: ATP-binding protein [Clostridia bacterium]|nr:ATP-binding protein [Clostridia bacterium]